MTGLRVLQGVTQQSQRPGWLADRQGRRLRYLRLSVTDRCDLRCQYCMPPEGVQASPRASLLSFEEAARVVRVFARLGVRTVRLTGGEPLVRRNLHDLVGMIRDVGIDDIALTTNATALAHCAQALARAGVKRVNVSLDAVEPSRFKTMTRGGDLSRVFRGIRAAQDAGISVIKTNTVVVRGHNDDHLEEIVEKAWSESWTPRFIELMPLGAAAALGERAVVSVSEMRARLSSLLEDGSGHRPSARGPAMYWSRRSDPAQRVGFIGAVTENFCDDCNRVRVTAQGQIRACLASPDGLDLQSLLRNGRDDDVLEHQIHEALFGKREGHGFGDPMISRHHSVAMSAIGG